MAGSGEPAAVAPSPRIFVGQLPNDVSVEQLADLFAPFAARGLRALNLVKRPDGVSKGCAMVLFERWAEAEAAMEAHNGKTRLNGGRPLVVSFANPKRIRPGEPPEPAIAPRKLFVGQVPKDATERDLRPLFEPFGEIICLNILRTQRGQGPSAGCAFVEFRKWAQAERAMEAHNGVTRLPGSDMPLVVKFADAKRPEAQYGGHMHGRQPWADMHHGLPPHTYPGPQGYGMQRNPLQFGGGMPYGMPNDSGLNPLNLPANQLLAMEAAQMAATQSQNPLINGPTQVPLHLSADGTPAQGSSPTAADAEAAKLLGNLSLNDAQAVLANGTAGGNGLGNVSLPVNTASIADTAALNAAINAGTASALADALANDSTGTANLLVAQQVLQQQQQQQQQQAAAVAGQLSQLQTPIGSLPDSMPANSSPSAALAAGFASLNVDVLASTSAAAAAAASAATSLQGQQNALTSGLSNGLNYLGGMAPQLGAASQLGGAPGLANGGHMSRGLDQAASQWKLFIGQVPMEATEQELWALFAPIGEVLELYVLRNNQTGRSRGCAFVTYSSRHLAQQAITALNGRQVGGGKNLVVKFADRVPM